MHLEPEAIDQCVRVCDQMLDMITDAMRESDHLGRIGGFGGFRIGQQLQAGYEAKAVTVVNRLYEYETAVLAMREAFASGGEAFADTEGQFAQALAVLENSADT